jgi:hypothetical protein
MDYDYLSKNQHSHPCWASCLEKVRYRRTHYANVTSDQSQDAMLDITSEYSISGDSLHQAKLR